MSQFPQSTSDSSTEFIILTQQMGQTVNARSPMSEVSPVIGSSRWILPAPTYASDPRGADGAESYKQVSPTQVDYYLKVGGMWYKSSTMTIVNPITL